MTDPDLHAMANSFDKAAEVYERSRPSYPQDAVDWLLESRPKRVLDLGAGTGKFTRLLVGRAETIYAVDPSENMLAQQDATSVTTIQGTAENIPLPDRSVDAVFVAQAWHWVDPATAIPEVTRVLANGGVLGLIWNVRDERIPWVKRLSDVMHNSKAELYVQDPDVPAGRDLERAEFSWTKPFTRPELLELVASRSYFITADDAEKAKIIAAVEDLLDNDPDIDWVLPYRTVVYRMRLG
jgi:ubiquinone/menaquinone biosynthesis C-methylase UbiE